MHEKLSKFYELKYKMKLQNKQRKIRYPLTVTQKINNKSPLTVYNYTKILNKYESTLNIIEQITKLNKFYITRKFNYINELLNYITRK